MIFSICPFLDVPSAHDIDHFVVNVTVINDEDRATVKQRILPGSLVALEEMLVIDR